MILSLLIPVEICIQSCEPDKKSCIYSAVLDCVTYFHYDISQSLGDIFIRPQTHPYASFSIMPWYIIKISSNLDQLLFFISRVTQLLKGSEVASDYTQ